MKNSLSRTARYILIFLIGFCSDGGAMKNLNAQTNSTLPEFHIYAGNTHSHTAFTWSHGDQYFQRGGKSNKNRAPLSITPDGAQSAPNDRVLKRDWKKFQGPPADQFALAKSNGYDFYVTTDHSQEAAFQPPSITNALWKAAARQATDATDNHFVALRGYEHSENNGPDAKGHINVINSAEYLNALAPGIDIPHLYHWLENVAPNGDGPVVASFNHPSATQYNNWAYRDPKITDIITMLEVINSNNKIHYAGFVNALDKGWKVSPICGNDNHGFYGIIHHTSRTFVLATNLTKVGILDAMKHRRTYASLDKNIQCRYFVNGEVMGSTLNSPGDFNFDISISDPDTTKPSNKITKIDIVKDHGEIVKTYNPTLAYSVHWTPTIHDSTNKFFFVRVWNAGGGDAPKADPSKPVAWLAPVWTGR
jgi:hypothetical protein